MTTCWMMSPQGLLCDIQNTGVIVPSQEGHSPWDLGMDDGISEKSIYKWILEFY